MNIVEKRLDEIRPYENNPRRNDEAVQYVARIYTAVRLEAADCH